MKKVLSALLVMLMLIQTVSFAANKVYSEEETMLLVDKLSMLGIFEQFDDELFFGDNANVKRSEAAVVISNMLGMKSSGGTAEIKFYDVPQFGDYASAVNYVTNLGIMSGNSAGLFLPDDTMEVVHVYKALVVALGYGWKAEAYGGYPAGYVKVASELEIANAVSKGINDTATRLDFLKMVEAALDAPICRMKSVSGDVMDFEIDEDVTVLSEYHNIYFDEGIVENSKSMNMSSTPEIDEDVVFIDGRKLYVDGVTSVYANFGYKVEYYYRHDSAAEADYLVAVVPSDDNTDYKISKADFGGFANGKITYYDENGKERDIKVSSSAVVIYNSEVATNVSTAINSFEGTLTVIDNNGDRQAEVIIAKNYTYDKVKTVKTADNRLYAESKVFNLNNYETVDIVLAETGATVELAAVEVGSVIGYATSVDGSKLMVDVLGSGLAVKVKSLSQDTFTTDDGKEYNMELLSSTQKGYIKPNSAISLVTMDGYYAVWVGLASEAAASLGYLINIATDTEFGEEYIIGARLLDMGGTIKALKTANDKKIILNGKSVNIATMFSELERVKAEYQLGGDGRVSQMVCYRIDDAGNLSHIYTVDNEDENTKLYLKFGFGRNGAAKMYTNFAYGTGCFTPENFVYDGAISNVHTFYTRQYMLPSATPVFKVPDSGQETAGEEWYAVKSATKDAYEGETVNIETFTNDKLGILPRAAVEYLPVDGSGIGTFNVINSGDVVMIDSTYQTLNDDDGVDYIVKGLSLSKNVTYTVDGTKVDVDAIDTRKAIAADPEEEAGFTTGDLAVVELDTLGKIVQIEKIYDRETRNINPALSPSDAADQVSALILHTYNKPADGYGLEFFEEDLTLGVPGDERKLLINLHGQGAGKVNEKAVIYYFYDDATESVYLGSSNDIVDYQQDPVNYTRIFAIHYNSKIGLAFYNYENN